MRKTTNAGTQVTYGEVEAALLQRGFKVYTSPEGYRILHHAPTDALIVLPAYDPDDRLYTVHLDDVRRTLAVHDLGSLNLPVIPATA